MNRHWYQFRAQAAGPAEIVIYDEIGAFGVPAKAFLDELRALGPVAELALRINSPGGSGFDGVAIYNALKRHGKHVLCEKPLSNTLKGARAMYRAAAGSGCIHQVGFVYRKWPAAAFAKKLIESGELGEIVHYRGRFFHDYGLDPALPVTWRLQKAISGGGSGADIGSHAIDMARYLIGEIAGVFARSRTHFAHRPSPDRPGESVAVDVDEITDMVVEFDSGVGGTLQTSWLAGGHKMDLGFAVHGTKGSVEFSSEQPTEVRLYRTSDPTSESGFRVIPLGPSHAGGELFWPVPGMALGFGDGFVIAARDMLRAIARHQPAIPDFLDGLRAQEVVTAAQASAADRSWQKVERWPVSGGRD